MQRQNYYLCSLFLHWMIQLCTWCNIFIVSVYLCKFEGSQQGLQHATSYKIIQLQNIRSFHRSYFVWLAHFCYCCCVLWGFFNWGLKIQSSYIFFHPHHGMRWEFGWLSTSSPIWVYSYPEWEKEYAGESLKVFIRQWP